MAGSSLSRTNKGKRKISMTNIDEQPRALLHFEDFNYAIELNDDEQESNLFLIFNKV